jgi:hypothetical protein
MSKDYCVLCEEFCVIGGDYCVMGEDNHVTGRDYCVLCEDYCVIGGDYCCRWRLLCCRALRLVPWCTLADTSKEPAAFIFRRQQVHPKRKSVFCLMLLGMQCKERWSCSIACSFRWYGCACPDTRTLLQSYGAFSGRKTGCCE